MLADVVNQTDDAEQKRQHIVLVAGLVVLHGFGQIVLRAETALVYELDARYPVAAEVVACAIVVEVVALNVVLATSEVPHKVTPVHPAQLVAVEEVEVLTTGGTLTVIALAGPVLVEARVVAFGVVAPHAGEEACVLLVVDVFLGVSGHDVAVLAFGVLSADILGVALFHAGRSASGIELACEERCVAVLLTSEVGAHGDSVLGGVLVEGRVGVGADNEHEEGAVADDQHGECQDCGVENRFLLLLGEPEADDDGGGQNGEEEDCAAVERQAESVDEEHVDSRVDINDARDDAPEDDAEGYDTQYAGDDETLPCCLGPFLEINHVEDGRNRQQVEQVDADGDADEEADEDEPPQRVRVVALLFPFHDGPEHQCGEE